MAKRRQKIEHKDGDRRLATFRIEHGRWASFLELCKGHQVTAGDVLSSFISQCISSDSIPGTEGDIVPNDIDIDAKISALIDDKISGFMADIQAMINGSIARAMEERSEPIESEPASIEPSEPADFSQGIIAARLAELFGVSKATIGNQADKGIESFKQWSMEKDPNGQSWTFSGDGRARRFFPIQ